MENSNIRPASLARITTPALAEAFISEQVAALRKQIGDRKVLLALSGGVDSSVVAALLIKAVGQQLVCDTSITVCSARESPSRSCRSSAMR